MKSKIYTIKGFEQFFRNLKGFELKELKHTQLEKNVLLEAMSLGIPFSTFVFETCEKDKVKILQGEKEITILYKSLFLNGLEDIKIFFGSELNFRISNLEYVEGYDYFKFPFIENNKKLYNLIKNLEKDLIDSCKSVKLIEEIRTIYNNFTNYEFMIIELTGDYDKKFHDDFMTYYKFIN